jgi:bacteriocin biosynthesis cyclodehydratase domain-containing protein
VVAAGLPTLPYLAPWYRLAEVEDGLVLEHGHTVVRLDGAAVRRLLPALLPLLDGTRTVEEVVSCVGEPARPAVERALRLLADHELVVEGPPGHESDPAAAAASFVAAASPANRPAALAEGLRRACVGVLGSGPLAAEVARSLRAGGITHVVPGAGRERLDLVAACPSPGETDVLAEWNREALERGLVWLQVLPFDGRFAAVGPLFVPGETCCRQCYVLRRHANVPYPDEFEALEASPVTAITPAPLRTAIAGLAALVVVRWLAGRDPHLPGALFALEAAEGLSLRRHLVHRVPRCPACSPAASGGRPLPWFPEVGLAHG